MAPDATEIITQGYSTTNDYIEVLQNTSSGPVAVDKYAIDPISTANGGGLTPTSAGGALYSDFLTDSNPVQSGGNWTSSYTLNHGDPAPGTLSFSITSGSTLLGTGSFDSSGNFHFVPHGTPPIAPTSAFQTDNIIRLTWGANPGTVTINAMYRSVIDRVLNINLANDVAPPPGGDPGQYTVELVSAMPLNALPMFTETTNYLPPTVSFAGGSPYVNSQGALTGTLFANSFVPGAAQGGPQGSTTDTKVSLYYTQSNSTTGGTLFDTLDFGTFLNNEPSDPFINKQGGFTWPGFESLPAGQYYVYAVINDGQNPQVDSTVSGPITTQGPTPVLSGPAFLALTPSNSGIEQGTFSTQPQAIAAK